MLQPLNFVSLQTFVATGGDYQARCYHLLDGMKKYHKEFDSSRLYPALNELVELHASLVHFLGYAESIQSRSQALAGVDVERGQLIYESFTKHSAEISVALDMARFALPKLQEVIEQGITIFSFVEDSIRIVPVGLTPLYCQEGYWFVPEHKPQIVNLFQYQASCITSKDGNYGALKVVKIGEVSQRIVRSTPEAIKQNLLMANHELPNPATWQCETELDFPYQHTILPVAKRKLLAKIHS